jgi:hypothetical protein
VFTKGALSYAHFAREQNIHVFAPNNVSLCVETYIKIGLPPCVVVVACTPGELETSTAEGVAGPLFSYTPSRWSYGSS